MGTTKDIRNVPEKAKNQVYEDYGIGKCQGYCSGPQGCEIDHLISLELGGANTIDNLWPQSLAFVAEPFVKNSAKGYGYFYHYDNIKPIGKDHLAAAWHFWPAGDVQYVFGVPGDPNDPFLQHHATTYRRLVGEQLRN